MNIDGDLASIVRLRLVFGALARVVVTLTYLQLASAARLVGAQLDAVMRLRVRGGGGQRIVHAGWRARRPG